MRDRAEAIARFLRLNYKPGTTAVPWDDADEDERDAWIEEALHICHLADQRGPSNIAVRFDEVRIDAIKPLAVADHYTTSTWIRAVVDREVERRQQPDWVDDGTLARDEVFRRCDEVRAKRKAAS